MCLRTHTGKTRLTILAITIGTFLFFGKSNNAFAIGGAMSGSGTAADPYLVEDYTDLKAVGTTYALSAVYRLASDIDASISASENGGRGFTPIGKSTPFFTGTFHGGGHAIKKLTINRPDSSYVGLFAYAKGLVDSLGLEELYLKAWAYVGGIAGSNTGTINQCYVTGSVTGNGGAAGGIAGGNDGYSTAGTMNGCYMSGSVSGANSVGGLVGSNYYGKIYNSYSTSPVVGSGSVGGLVGANSSGTVIKSYATGSVTGSGNYVGGLIGMNTFYYGGSVIKSYATGPVKGTASYIGGLVGYNYGWNIGTVSYCYSSGSVTGGSTVGGLLGYHATTTLVGSYWDVNASGQTTGIGSNSGTGTPTGLTTSQMKSSANFGGWSFDTTWAIRADSTYPGLKILNNAPFAFGESLSTDRTFALSRLLAGDHDIESGDTSLILHLVSTSAGTTDSVNTLTLPGSVTNGTVITVKYRVGEVRLQDTLWGNTATSYVTLVTLNGSGTEGDPFLIANYTDLKTVGINSTYNLASVYRVIADIDATPSAAENSGAGFVPIGNIGEYFVGAFHGGGHKITGLVINRPDTSYVGLFGVTGSFYPLIDSLGMVNGCVTGRNFVGGIVGYASQSTAVNHCFNTGTVTGQDEVGGVIGRMFDANFTGCRNTGNVSGHSTIGGVLGSADYGSVTLSSNTGKVTGSGYDAGGIIGISHAMTVSICYNTGDISSALGTAGGISGYAYASGTIADCYNTGRISVPYRGGGVIGQNGAFNTVERCYNAGEVSGAISGGVAGSQEFNGTIKNSYWDLPTCGQVLACGDNSEGGTITAVTGLTTAELKDQSNLSNLNFTGTWAIRADSTYPGLQSLDNAPFAFADTSRSGRQVDLTNLLVDDYDFETVQNKLLMHVLSITAGTTDSSSQLTLPDSVISGLIDTVVYRIGEIRSADTLWGNVAKAFIIIDNEPPDQTVQIAPADNGAVNDSLAQFLWNVTPDDYGLGYYQLILSTDSLFTTVLYDTSVSDTNISLAVSIADSFYYWRVRAVDACGNIGQFSETWQFELDVTGPTAPVLLAPADSSWQKFTTVYCSWTASDKASPVYYVLKAYRLPDTLNPVISDTTGLTADTLTVAEGRYAWKVEAHDQAGNPPGVSALFNFGCDQTAPAMAVLAAPANGLTTNQDSVSFAWHPGIDTLSGINHYQLQYAYDSEFSQGLVETTLTDTAITLALADSSYYWRVGTWDNVGNWSTWVAWRLTVDTHDPYIPNLLAPADNSWLTVDTAFCSWSAVAKSDKASPVYYVLKAYQLPDSTSPFITDTTYQTSDTLLIGQGRYRWLVEAHDEAGNPPGISSYYNFGRDNVPPSTVVQISPADSLITNQGNVTFCWHPSSDAVSGIREYAVVYALDESFSSGVAETTLTDTSIVLSLPDSIYYWMVEARDTVGNVGVSYVWQLNVDTHDPSIPVLASPSDSVWTSDTTMICAWNEVAKKSKASNVSYIIQLDTNNTFASPIIDDTTNILLDTFSLSEDQYYWRVMAFDAAGNYGTYSNYRTFGIDTTAPDIQYVLDLGDDATSPYGPYEVTGKVYDLSGVKVAYMFTRINGGSWDSTAMFFASDSLRDSIPELNPATDETLSVSYYIKATDMLDHQTTSSTYNFKAIGPSGVSGRPERSMPTVYALDNAYPNPSRGQTIFKYQLPKESNITLTVYNVVGQQIKRFDIGNEPAGYHQVNWNDNSLPNGVYIYQLKAGAFTSTKKLMVVR